MLDDKMKSKILDVIFSDKWDEEKATKVSEEIASNPMTTVEANRFMNDVGALLIANLAAKKAGENAPLKIDDIIRTIALNSIFDHREDDNDEDEDDDDEYDDDDECEDDEDCEEYVPDEPEKKTESNSVAHPAHYTRGNIEVIDFIEDQQLDFCLGNAVKYICRAGYKDPRTFSEDIRKAIWYLNRELEERGAGSK